MIGALLFGFVAGVVARVLMPGDVFRKMSGPASWGLSLVLGLAGALLGYVIFTLGLGSVTPTSSLGRSPRRHHRHADRARSSKLFPAPPRRSHRPAPAQASVQPQPPAQPSAQAPTQPSVQPQALAEPSAQAPTQPQAPAQPPQQTQPPGSADGQTPSSPV